MFGKREWIGVITDQVVATSHAKQTFQNKKANCSLSTRKEGEAVEIRHMTFTSITSYLLKTADEDNRLFADNTPLHSNDEDKRENQMVLASSRSFVTISHRVCLQVQPHAIL